MILSLRLSLSPSSSVSLPSSLFSPSVSFPPSPSLHLSLSLSVSLSLSLSVSLCLCLSLFISLLCLSLFVCLSISLSVSFSLSLSLPFSWSLSFLVPFHPLCLSLHFYVCHSLYAYCAKLLTNQSHGFPISYMYVVDRLLERVLSERVRGRALENSPSVSRSAFILRFPRVIDSLMYGHVRAIIHVIAS